MVLDNNQFRTDFKIDCLCFLGRVLNVKENMCVRRQLDHAISQASKAMPRIWRES